MKTSLKPVNDSQMESKNKHLMFHQNIPHLDVNELDCGHYILKNFSHKILVLFVQKISANL